MHLLVLDYICSSNDTKNGIIRFVKFSWSTILCVSGIENQNILVVRLKWRDKLNLESVCLMPGCRINVLLYLRLDGSE